MKRNIAFGMSGATGILVLSAALMAAAVPASGVDAPTSVMASFHTFANAEGRVLVAQADVASGTPATYSSEQADRGEATYKKECVECHGDDLRGGLLGGPPLRGVAFEDKYAKGAPAGVLFEIMSGTMPPNAPGRYSASTYADIMAYLLKRNGFAASAPLPDNVDTLYELVIQK